MVNALTTFTLSLSSIDYEIFYGLPGGRITIYDFTQYKQKENDNNRLLLHAYILPTPYLFYKVHVVAQILYTLFDKEAFFRTGKQKEYCKYLQTGKIQIINYTEMKTEAGLRIHNNETSKCSKNLILMRHSLILKTFHWFFPDLRN